MRYSKFITAKICRIRFLLHAFALSSIHLKDLTCAHKTGRVRAPPSIYSTHCPHPPSWDKPWVTSKEYLSSLNCVLVCLNRTIVRSNWLPTTDWKKVMQNTTNNPDKKTKWLYAIVSWFNRVNERKVHQWIFEIVLSLPGGGGGLAYWCQV